MCYAQIIKVFNNIASLSQKVQYSTYSTKLNPLKYKSDRVGFHNQYF